MTKMNKIAVGVAAALAMGLASAGVYAAPAAGEAPFADDVVSMQSGEQGQFDWLAARTAPAAGEFSAVAAIDHSGALTRAEVKERFMQAEHDTNGFPDAAGELML